MSSTRPIIEMLASEFLYGSENAMGEIEAQYYECASIRAVICTNDPGAVELDLGLGVSSNDHLTPLLEGPCAWFHSGGISLQSRLESGKSFVPIDYSLSFDSNFAEKLRAVISGENISRPDRDAVNGVLMLKARNKRVQFDVFPFIIENTRLARNSKNNRRPAETLAAFYMLDGLDWENFLQSGGDMVFCCQRDILKETCLLLANNFIEELKLNN